MIAGGNVDGGEDEMTEIVELLKTNSTPSFGQIPSKRSRPVGTWFGAPLICGGSSDTKEVFDTCIFYDPHFEFWYQSHSLTVNRYASTGVQINSTTFWMLGGTSELSHLDSKEFIGTSEFSHLDSTEFIIQGQNHGVPGPKLPHELLSMCSVKLSDNEIFVIGGFDGSRSPKNEVWIYDPQNGFARSQGPSLTTERYHHSCSTMNDGEKTLIIVAGGFNNINLFLDSVEIYDPTDKTWHSGMINSKPQNNFSIFFFKPKLIKTHSLARRTKKYNLYFLPQVQFYLIEYFQVLWLKLLMVEGFCSLVEAHLHQALLLRTEYWNCVLGPILGTFWTLLYKIKDLLIL